MGSVARVFLIAVFASTSFAAESRNSDSSNLKIIGLLPHRGKSHFDVFAPFLEELSRRGHEVTVVSYFPRAKVIPNYRDISPLDSDGILVNSMDMETSTKRGSGFFSFLYTWAKGLRECEKALENPKLLNLLESGEKFDLVLIEMFNTDCLFGVAHKFQAPYVALSTHVIMPWVNDRFGNPDNPGFIPELFGDAAPKMTFFERVRNTVRVLSQKTGQWAFSRWLTQPVVNAVLGPQTPSLTEIANNVSAILVNTHFSIHGARPMMPNVIEVGGVHIPSDKSLPKDVQEFLDEAPRGALYFSWGSMLKSNTIHEDKLAVILKVFASLPQKVVWKWESDDLPGKPDNVMIRKWMPQYDILRKFLTALRSIDNFTIIRTRMCDVHRDITT